jgi:hypothetical protein
VALASVALAAALAGCGSSSPSGADSPSASAVSAPASTTSAPAPTVTVTKTVAPTATPTPYKTTSSAHTEPWKVKAADFGYVRKAVAVSGGVEITFDRAIWLTAAMVPAWNTAHPTAKVTAEDDYAIVNQNPELRTFLVRSNAALFGSIMLTGESQSSKITAAQLVSGIAAAGKLGVTCWIYHVDGGLTGDVVQLEEQYRP